MEVLTLRPARWRDVFKLWRWRNDETTRAMMMNSSPVEFMEHVRWFRDMRRVGSDVLIARWLGVDIGMCRLFWQRWNGTIECDVSFSVAREHRGNGHGVRILLDVEDYLFDEDARGARRCRPCRLVGIVKRENYPSKRSFRRAGYAEADDTGTLSLVSFYKDVP